MGMGSIVLALSLLVICVLEDDFIAWLDARYVDDSPNRAGHTLAELSTTLISRHQRI